MTLGEKAYIIIRILTFPKLWWNIVNTFYGQVVEIYMYIFQSVIHPKIQVISGDDTESEAVTSLYHWPQSDAVATDQSQLLIDVFTKRTSVKQQSPAFSSQAEAGDDFPKQEENRKTLIEELDWVFYGWTNGWNYILVFFNRGSAPEQNLDINYSCRSKPVKPLFIFGTQIKIFFIKSKCFLTLRKQQRSWNVPRPRNVARTSVK